MRELIRYCEVETEETEVLELRYYLLFQESDNFLSCEAHEGVLYGVSVSAAIRGNGKRNYIEVSDNGLTYLKSEAIDFINEIADACVTPESFLCVIDDYVGAF